MTILKKWSQRSHGGRSPTLGNYCKVNAFCRTCLAHSSAIEASLLPVNEQRGGSRLTGSSSINFHRSTQLVRERWESMSPYCR